MVTPIPNYFFLEGRLYKKVRTVKSENILVAWGFEEEKRMWFNYQQTIKNYQTAYLLKEVAALVERNVQWIKSMIDKGWFSRGSGMAYTIATRRPYKNYWSEDDVFILRQEIFALAKKNKYGEPYSNFNLISEAELLHKMRGGESYFIQDENGKKIKVWRAI